MDIATREVKALLHDGSKTVTVLVRAVVNSGTSRRTTDNAQETIDQCNLNGVKTTTSTYDRRVMNRTLAWFACLKSLSLLARVQKDMQPLAWQMLLMTAASTGFYSVWLTIIEQVFPGIANNFVTDTNKALYYPGTDTKDLP